MRDNRDIFAVFISIVLFFSMTVFVLGSTAGLDVAPYPPSIVPAYVFVFIAVLLIAYVCFCIIKPGQRKKLKQNGAFIMIIGSFISLILLWISFIYGWHHLRWLEDYIESGDTLITSNETYEYRLDVVNSFQANSYARLWLREIATDGEFTVTLDINTLEMDSLIGSDWCILTVTDEDYIYRLETTTRFYNNITYIFEIDMNTRVATKISETIYHRTTVAGFGGWTHRYWIELQDIYVEEERVNVEVLFGINFNNTPAQYINLPIETEVLLMSTDILQQPGEHLYGWQQPIWISVKETDIEGQLIVQTNEEFSTEITLTFLVDVYAGTAEKITVE
jgi:hypothetical protein